MRREENRSVDLAAVPRQAAKSLCMWTYAMDTYSKANPRELTWSRFVALGRMIFPVFWVYI